LSGACMGRIVSSVATTWLSAPVDTSAGTGVAPVRRCPASTSTSWTGRSGCPRGRKSLPGDTGGIVGELGHRHMGQKLGRRHGFFDGLEGFSANSIRGFSPAASQGRQPYLIRTCLCGRRSPDDSQLPGHLLADLLPQYLTVWAVPLVLRQVMDMFDHRRSLRSARFRRPPRPSPLLALLSRAHPRVMVAGSVPAQISATTGRASRWAANSRSIWPRAPCRHGAVALLEATARRWFKRGCRAPTRRSAAGAGVRVLSAARSSGTGRARERRRERSRWRGGTSTGRVAGAGTKTGVAAVVVPGAGGRLADILVHAPSIPQAPVMSSNNIHIYTIVLYRPGLRAAGLRR